MGKWDKIDINNISYRFILYNLYVTQLISLVISFVLFMLFLDGDIEFLLDFIVPRNLVRDLLIAFVFASLIVLINIILTNKVPKKYLDDGGINKKLFINTPIWHIAIISIIVGFTEELLFRLFIQLQFGIVVASILFTLLHFRYFDKIVLVLYTFFISILLGYLVIIFDWFTAFLAHFLIDFMLGVLIRKKIIEY